MEDGAGTFDYSVRLSSQPSTQAGPLTFIVKSSAGSITSVNFETLSNGGSPSADFAANVSNGSCTGIIGGGNGTAQSTPQNTNSDQSCPGTPPVPEPTSIAFFGTGLIGVGIVIRRKLALVK
jgi:hypothetical protein